MVTTKKLLLELSGEHKELPIEELRAVIQSFAQRNEFGSIKLLNEEIHGRLVKIELLDRSGNLVSYLNKRLSMSHRICELIASGSLKNIYDSLTKLDNLDNIQDSTFKLYTHLFKSVSSWSRAEITELKNKIIHEFSKLASVDVNDPKNKIMLYRDTQLFLARVLFDIPRGDFEERKPQNRPYFAPVSLHPRLARCLVNLTGLGEGGTILDPFCGTGGLLIEAGLMGMNIIGTDIDLHMVEGTQANLAHLGIKNYSLFQSDINKLSYNMEKYSTNDQTSFGSNNIITPDAIVTEPPYGRASTTQGKTFKALMEQSFNAFSNILHAKAPLVISLPVSELPKTVSENFKLLNKFNLRIHRSLTKTIFILQKQ